jgi:TPR repeat protein
MHRFFATLFIAVSLASFPAAAQDGGTETQMPPTHEEIAQARLGYIAGDYEAALEILLPAAEAGDANAQNILGAAYEDGNGVERDLKLAQAWWEKAAAQDFDKALFNLGRFFATEDPAYPTDHSLAVGYFERAIALGYGEAHVERGRMHELGLGGPADDAAAAVLFQKAVELGNVRAMNRLGNFYVEARGVEEDLAYAFELFHRAAMLGDATGLNNLGAMYHHGYGVGRDLMAALALYEKAAYLGNAQAAVNLAFLLTVSPSGWKDPIGGYAWCLAGVERARPDERIGLEADCAELAGGLDDLAKSQAAERAAALAR